VAKVFMTIAAAFAEFEREQISERVADMKRDQRDRGKYLGGKVPFGFTVHYEPDGDGKKMIPVMDPVPEEQRIIAEIRQVRGAGKSLRYIRDHVEHHHKRRLALPTIMRIVGVPGA
jgi:DNA invertase Pin-like site-specific DNA recombinase